MCTDPKSGDWKSVFSGLGSAQLLRLDEGGDIWPGSAVGTLLWAAGSCGDTVPELGGMGPPLLLVLLLLLPPRLIGLPPPVVVKTPR